jgi:hypothetical protein
MQIFKHIDFLEKTKDFNEASQIWIYFAPSIFSEAQIQLVNQNMDTFLSQWNAHKVSLEAVGMILYNQCIVLSVNKETAQASGCSVDASVRFIKELGMEIQIDFFRRDLFFTLENEKMNSIEINNIKDIFEKNTDIEVMSPFYLNLKEFRNNITQKIPFSAFKRMVKF